MILGDILGEVILGVRLGDIHFEILVGIRRNYSLRPVDCMLKNKKDTHFGAVVRYKRWMANTRSAYILIVG